MSQQARAVFEAIAFGDDPQITPSDRLRACEQLARFDDSDEASRAFSGELSALEGAELNAHLDALLAEEIAADIFGARSTWPHLASLIDGEIERRARTLAEERSLDMVEVEVQRRVTETVARREREEYAQPQTAAAPTAMASAVASEASKYEPRYRPESALRRRSRPLLISR